ncbi:MAG: PadR family transcriptional regulator [Candidatus Thorarchaeota archaeon]|jgi:DNA-binding PadR family transcriptional regulator
MFNPFRRLVEVFREKGATTPEKAMTWKELGLPDDLEHISPALPPDESPIVKKGRRYYLSEERLKSFRKEFAPMRKWIQHTAKVPKGFLRYQVLQKLKEGPMSGSELTEAIEEEMGGRWTPKPGSIYPLLKSLLQDGLTQEVPAEDGRTRRYELTTTGLKFLEDQVNQSGELLEKIGHGFTPFPPFFLGPHAEIPLSFQNLFKTLQSLRVIAGGNPSPEILKELSQAADRFTKDLEKIRKKMETTE